jgi:hypothetical protein
MRLPSTYPIILIPASDLKPDLKYKERSYSEFPFSNSDSNSDFFYNINKIISLFRNSILKIDSGLLIFFLFSRDFFLLFTLFFSVLIFPASV